MRPLTKALRIGALLGGWSLLACGVPAAPEARLTEVEIAPDFTFETQRPLEVTVDADFEPRLVEIFGPDGASLYRGPLGVGAPPSFPVAAWIDRLLVRIDEPDGPREVVSTIEDGRAVVRLGDQP